MLELVSDYPDLNKLFRNLCSLEAVLVKNVVLNPKSSYSNGLGIACRMLEDEIYEGFKMKGKREYIVKVYEPGDPGNILHECVIKTHRSMIDAVKSWVKDNPKYQNAEKYTWTCWMEVKDEEDAKKGDTSED